MKYNNQWVIDNNKTDFLFFWGNDSERPYSQWQPSPFKSGEVTFPTAEHWMMYNKALFFGDKESAEIILRNPNPDAVKRQGRLVKNFDNDKWNEVKYEIVVEGNKLKFQQNPEMAERLLSTGDKVIVEASPYDTIWGIGMDEYNPNKNDPSKWKGENLLGYAIMEVRDFLRTGIDEFMEEIKKYI